MRNEKELVKEFVEAMDSKIADLRDRIVRIEERREFLLNRYGYSSAEIERPVPFREMDEPI